MGAYSDLVQVGLVIVFLAICYQDFKERAVYWWLYLLVFVLFSLEALLRKSFHLQESLINLGFLSIQYIVVIVYFGIKNGEFKWFLLDDFGLGDAVLIITLAVFLPNDFFLFVYLSSLISSLLWVVVMNKITSKSYSIPLAGVLSIVMVLITTLSYVKVDKMYYFSVS